MAFSVKGSGSFSSHLDACGSVSDQQSIRYSSGSSNLPSQNHADFRKEGSVPNRKLTSHHGSQSSNLSGEANMTHAELQVRHHQGISRDNIAPQSRINTSGDQRARSISRSR